jgi:hypothetical protein
MSTPVELQSSLQTNRSLNISGGRSFRKGLLSSIQSSDVGLVMLGVVEGHYFGGNGGFESLERELD